MGNGRGGVGLMVVGEGGKLYVINVSKTDGTITNEEVSDKEVLELSGKSCVGVTLKPKEECATQKIKCKKVGTATWTIKGNPGEISQEMKFECDAKKGDFFALLEGWEVLAILS